MLALAERYFAIIAQAKRDTDVVDILRDVAADLGYRSAFLIEYSEDLKSAIYVLDSNSKRAGWWNDYIAKGLRKSPDEIAKMLAGDGVLEQDESRFSGPEDPFLAFCRRIDLVECTLVPVSHNGQLVGLCGFSGLQKLDPRQQMGLQLVTYALFAHVRSFRKVGTTTALEPLTPREKEVMALSAEGLTSADIAVQLGMSARTVNQHVDNVSNKLNTKNRAHTVAEVIRRRML